MIDYLFIGLCIMALVSSKKAGKTLLMVIVLVIVARLLVG